MRLPNPDLNWPICREAVALIAERESLRLRAYRCPAGVWTCGYGCTQGVAPTTVWTEDDADQHLLTELQGKTAAVLAMCKEHPDSNQLGALVSLAYNIGIEGLRGSTVLKCHNRGDFQAAARAFGLWNKAKVNGTLTVLPGLTARRAAEAALYLKPEDEAPHEAMPQALESESGLAQSPIAQSGAATAGVGALGVVSAAGDQLGSVGQTVETAKHFVIDTLGIPADWFLPALLVGVGGFVVYHRIAQRRNGWA